MTGFSRLLVGKVLSGRYRVDGLIGKGGMGAVFRATDLQLERSVAVKVISIELDTPEQAARLRARFRREAKAAARLRHPNVVTLYDSGSDDGLGLDFIIMELLDGEDLQAVLGRVGRIPWQHASWILHQAACGLGTGHRAGLIHRDVKPANLFLERGPGGSLARALVLDFGIAQITDDALNSAATATHLTVHGSGPLTPTYASPEQLRGEPLTPAADVFALGVVAYEVLTGERPFSPGSRDPTRPDTAAERAVMARLESMIPPTAVELIGASLAFEAARRPQDGGAFAEILARIISGKHPPKDAQPAQEAREPAGTSTPSAPRGEPAGPSAKPVAAGQAPASGPPDRVRRRRDRAAQPSSRTSRVWPLRVRHIRLRALALLTLAMFSFVIVLGLARRGILFRPPPPRFMAPAATPALEQRVAELDQMQRATDTDSRLRQRGAWQVFDAPAGSRYVDSARMTVFERGGEVRKLRYDEYSSGLHEVKTYYYRGERLDLATMVTSLGRMDRLYFEGDSVIRWTLNGQVMESSGEWEGYDERSTLNSAENLRLQVRHMGHPDEWTLTDAPPNDADLPTTP